jgi:hypothetical protein
MQQFYLILKFIIYLFFVQVMCDSPDYLSLSNQTDESTSSAIRILSFIFIFPICVLCKSRYPLKIPFNFIVNIIQFYYCDNYHSHPSNIKPSFPLIAVDDLNRYPPMNFRQEKCNEVF